MRRATWLLFATFLLGLVGVSAHARRVPQPEPVPVEAYRVPEGRVLDSGARFTRATGNTTVLYTASFDVGGSCNAQGWTSVDWTAQPGVFFHVDDYAGLNPAEMFPLDGAQSLWCGARPQSTGPLCGYRTLPGYGNRWDQSFITKACVPVSGDGILDLDMIIRAESEPGYDFTFFEWTLDCAGETGWTSLLGTNYYEPIPVNSDFDIGTTGPIRFRFHFVSDGAWSDEDGIWPTHGAVHIDSLALEGLPLEDFEGEAVGATETEDWLAFAKPGFGAPATLILGASALQEDPCVTDLSCMWAFFVGSTDVYDCGATHPEQLAVPRVNSRGQYLNNALVSPDIPLIGTGDNVVLEFDVYRDMPLDDLVFYNWEVRQVIDGCPASWINSTSVYYGAQKDWHRSIHPVGDLLTPSATHFNVALWAADFCYYWCGSVGTGACHNHAPLFDNVKVYRVEAVGPQWQVRDIDQFQDNFATDGTITGTVRADMANDILSGDNPNILPGDSSVVLVKDLTAGLATDPGVGGAAVYAYVAVRPQGQPGKSGAGLSDDALRWPVTGTWIDAGGVEWTCIRLDTTRVYSLAVPDSYCLDLNDDLFTPGDTVSFFYCAKNSGGVETYAFGTDLKLSTLDRDEAAASPGEFTCLPAGGYQRGGDILYVDGMDGRGAQPAFDLAFTALGILELVDRFDVRAPSSLLANRLAGRVSHVANQLNGPYRKIIWDTGDLAVTLGDGSLSPEKTDDYALLNAFLDGLGDDGGAYLCGDDLAAALDDYTSASANAFKTTNLPFVLTAGDHRPAFGVSPVGTSTGLCFTTDATFIVQGGCPLLNDFDVLEPAGTSAMEIAYGAPAGSNGAVLSNSRVNGNNATVGVLLAGFSFVYITDDEVNGVSDRADHLHDVITWLGNAVGGATGTVTPYRTALGQNYPNPFNPQTSIAFSLGERGRVRLAVYDVSGALVRELVNGARERGAYTEVWDGRDGHGVAVATGVYFYRLETLSGAHSRKMVLLK